MELDEAYKYRVKLEAQDHSYQHLNCTSHSLQLWNSQLAKKRKWKDRSKKKKACNY
jgi:hypothetical protein